MLGVIHRDSEGIGLLRGWLETCKPDVVTLEFTRFGLRFRQSHGEELKNRVKEAAGEMAACAQNVEYQTLSDVLAYLDPPFEYTVASEYTASRGIPLHLIDLNRFSRIGLSHMEDLVSKGNLQKALSEPAVANSYREKTLARLYFEKGVTAIPYSSDMEIRDKHMAGIIKTLMNRHKNGHVVHICGWQHLCDPHNLYGHLFPRKVFIYEEGKRK